MNTDEQKVSYIIGRQVGGDMKSQGMDISFEEFFSGVQSSFDGKPSEVDEEETQRVMTAFQEKMQEAHDKLAAEAAKVNVEQGQAFLEENKAQDGVQVTDSGLQYKVIESGSGATPSLTSTIEAHYEGTLVDGTVFDSSYKRGETVSFPVNGVIPGWTEALQLMKEGDVWELVIPSDLAYGARGAGGAIGPHAVLKFRIELIAVK